MSCCFAKKKYRIVASKYFVILTKHSFSLQKKCPKDHIMILLHELIVFKLKIYCCLKNMFDMFLHDCFIGEDLLLRHFVS